MSQRRAYRELPDIELGPELDQKVRSMTETADRDIADARVTFSWGPSQLATVKRAAAIIGVSYQAYMKHVLLRQAVADIHQAEGVVDRQDDPSAAR